MNTCWWNLSTRMTFYEHRNFITSDLIGYRQQSNSVSILHFFYPFPFRQLKITIQNSGHISIDCFYISYLVSYFCQCFYIFIVSTSFVYTVPSFHWNKYINNIEVWCIYNPFVYNLRYLLNKILSIPSCNLSVRRWISMLTIGTRNA